MPNVVDGVEARIFGDPIALDDFFAVQEDTTLDVSAALGLLSNDGDPEGEDVSISVITDSVDNGSLAVFADGRMIYTPDPGFTGTDSFQFRVVDQSGNSTISTATITVYENSPPQAADENYTVMEGTALSVGTPGILSNDIDTGGENVEATLILDSTDNGSLSLFAFGNFAYTPDPGFVGTDSFTYRISDEASNIDTATATITVVENPGPTAADDYYTVLENSNFSLGIDGVLSNDLDPDGSEISAVLILDSVDNGTLSLFGDGSLSYTPDAGFTGTDSFTYRMRDEAGNTDEAVVTFTVVAAPPPIAVDDYFITRENEALTIATPGILGNDLDLAGGGVEAILILDTVDDGSLSLFGPGNFTYTPDPGFVGTSSFDYRIRNDAGEIADATATITVVENLGPTAVDDAYSVQLGSTLDVDAANGLLTNDFDPEGGANAVNLILDSVDNGSLSVFADGSFTYTADPAFAGTDSFTYRMRDEFGNFDTATVTIDVYFGFFLVPPTVVDDAYSVGENGTLDVSAALGVLANDYDANNNAISVTLITDSVDNGTVSLFPDGRFIYTPDSGFVGTDSFDYRITDSTGASSIGTATIVVVENADPVASPDTYAVLRGQTLTILAAEGVLANDLDPEGTDLTVSVILDNVDNGSLALFADGNFIYTPDAGFVGTDSFTYRVRDEDGQTSMETVTLIVEAPADPVAMQDEYSVLGNRQLTVAASEGVLANDLSLDGSDLSVILITDGVDNGALSLFADGNFIYTPDAGFVGTDSFSYRIRSENGGVETATVTLNVIEDPAPVAGDDSYAVIAGNALNVGVDEGVLINDVDPSGDELSVVLITDGVDNGSLALFADGNFSYTPDAGFSGTDSFSYRVRDEFGFTDTAVVTIEVVAPAAPIALDNAYFTYAGTPLSIGADLGVLANDVSPDGLDINVVLITDGVDNGSLSLFADGSFTYTPDAGFAGVDSFTYQIRDEFGNIDTAEVAIGVRGNVAPVVMDDEATTLENTSVTIDVLDNDIDPNGDSLFIGSLSDPANGSVFSVFGEIVYIPDAGFSGEDTFTYRAFDTFGLSTEGTVTVTVDPIVLPPVNYTTSSISEVLEGDAGNQMVSVTITRDDASEAAFVSLEYSGSATLGDDYTTDAPAGVNFAAGSFSQTFDLTILGDTDVELDELITISIDDVISGRDFVGDATSTTILNDDMIVTPPPLNVILDGDGSGVLVGTDGADSLQSNGGNYDRMTGGAGADEFEFGAETNNGVRERDIVTDYEVGIDILRLVEGAQIASLRDISSGVLVTFVGDGDRAYIRGEGFTAADLIILTEDEMVL